MKIALCLSGDLRSIKSNYHSLDKHLLSKYNVDIFLSTWNSSDGTTLPNKELNLIIRLLNPKKYHIEPPINFTISKYLLNRNIEPLRNANGVLSMFYKLKHCNSLKSDFEIENNFKYDIVIRSRPDILLFESIKIIQNNTLMIPKYGDFSGINDQFAYGPSDLMNIYSNMFDNIESSLSSNDKIYLKPELLLRQYLINQSLPVNRFNLEYCLARTNGNQLFNKFRDLKWHRDGLHKNFF